MRLKGFSPQEIEGFSCKDLKNIDLAIQQIHSEQAKYDLGGYDYFYYKTREPTDSKGNSDQQKFQEYQDYATQLYRTLTDQPEIIDKEQEQELIELNNFYQQKHQERIQE